MQTLPFVPTFNLKGQVRLWERLTAAAFAAVFWNVWTANPEEICKPFPCARVCSDVNAECSERTGEQIITFPR